MMAIEPYSLRSVLRLFVFSYITYIYFDKYLIFHKTPISNAFGLQDLDLNTTVFNFSQNLNLLGQQLFLTTMTGMMIRFTSSSLSERWVQKEGIRQSILELDESVR